MWYFRFIFLLFPLLFSCQTAVEVESVEETNELTLCDCAKFNMEQGRDPFKPFMSAGFRIKVQMSYRKYFPCDRILREFEKLPIEKQEEAFFEIMENCISPEEMMKYAK